MIDPQQQCGPERNNQTIFRMLYFRSYYQHIPSAVDAPLAAPLASGVFINVIATRNIEINGNKCLYHSAEGKAALKHSEHAAEVARAPSNQ